MLSFSMPSLPVILTRSVRDHIPAKVLRMLLGLRLSTPATLELASLLLSPPDITQSGTTAVVCSLLGATDAFAGKHKQ
jgi:hypothetical protein